MKGTKKKTTTFCLSCFPLLLLSYKYRKKPNEVRKNYMDMMLLNAEYLFSVIKQRTTVIKKKTTFALNYLY